MKTPRLLLALLPLALLAASSLPRHQAFGPLRFGMAQKEAEEMFRHLHHAGSKDAHSMSAAEARAAFVTNGALRLSRLPDFDRALPVFVQFRANPLLDQVSVTGLAKPAPDYAKIKNEWEDFQDFGDCKFIRKSEKGIFPPMETVDAAQLDPSTHMKTVVTDTWETEGVRVELAVQYVDPSATTYMIVPPRYRTVLIATEIAPPQ